MIDPDRFIADCLGAQAADTSFRHVREVVARAVVDPALILRCLGEPRRPAMQKLYHAPGLTILNVILAPGMTIPPHDHRMRAVIGVYTGREDNIFWQRTKGRQGGKIEAVGAKALSSSDAELLDANVVHSVSNPLTRLTGAIHVYDGDFFAAERSEWDPETLLEQAFEAERAIARFEGM
jgi:predicted metal-dependent enzyme (double-stranded beta helix superfamily)